MDATFKAALKSDLFVQDLNLKWQEKVLPSAKTFPNALHQARTAEEQERYLGQIYGWQYIPLLRKEITQKEQT